MGILLLITVVYFLPSLIAFHRFHPSRMLILLVNFFFGWTGIGWILLLVWALSHPRYMVVAPCCYPHYRRW